MFSPTQLSTSELSVPRTCRKSAYKRWGQLAQVQVVTVAQLQALLQTPSIEIHCTPKELIVYCYTAAATCDYKALQLAMMEAISVHYPEQFPIQVNCSTYRTSIYKTSMVRCLAKNTADKSSCMSIGHQHSKSVSCIKWREREDAGRWPA
jgi:hypothetical protein